MYTQAIGLITNIVTVKDTIIHLFIFKLTGYQDYINKLGTTIDPQLLTKVIQIIEQLTVGMWVG